MKKMLFKLNKDKTVKLYKCPKENNDIAYCRLCRIFVKKEFKKFTRGEQEAIVYHELYHKRLFNYLLACWYVLTKNKRGMKKEELNADKYSAIMCGKDGLISVLKKSIKSFSNQPGEYGVSQRDRIKKLQKLDVDKYTSKLQYRFTENFIFECKKETIHNLRKTLRKVYFHRLSWLIILITIVGLIFNGGDIPFNNRTNASITCFSLLASIILVSIFLKATDKTFDGSGFGLFGLHLNTILNFKFKKHKKHRRKNKK